MKKDKVFKIKIEYNLNKISWTIAVFTFILTFVFMIPSVAVANGQTLAVMMFMGVTGFCVVVGLIASLITAWFLYRSLKRKE